jgi:hypothetical protein
LLKVMSHTHPRQAQLQAHHDDPGRRIRLAAAAAAIAINAESELLIHGQNGKIRERNTYGHDPRRTKG